MEPITMMKTGTEAAGAIYGIVAGSRQQGQQQELMDYQNKLNWKTMDKSQRLQKDMYEYTGYGSKVRQMKEAGLNPALMYGGSGAGGGTTGSGAALGVSGGQAPNAAANIGMGLQLAKLRSEIAVNESVAKVNEAEATKKTTVDTQKTTAEITNLSEITKNEVVKRKLLEIEATGKNIQNEIAMFTKDSSMTIIEEQARKLEGEANSAISEAMSDRADAQVKTATVDTIIEQTNATLAKTMADIIKIKADTEVSEEKAREIVEGIKGMYFELLIKNNGQKIENSKVQAMIQNNINDNNTKIDIATMQALSSLAGRLLPGVTGIRK